MEEKKEGRTLEKRKNEIERRKKKRREERRMAPLRAVR